METFEELEQALEQLRNEQCSIERQIEAIENELRRRVIEESWDDGWA